MTLNAQDFIKIKLRECIARIDKLMKQQEQEAKKAAKERSKRRA